MSDREKMVRFLRDKAEQFRRLGTAHDTPLSPRMLEFADDLETKADEIEARQTALTAKASPARSGGVSG